MSQQLETHSNLLRLLSYNIQVGSHTSRYRHYVTRSWRQLIPNRSQLENLDAISRLLQTYDFVGLQEVDGGSFRTGFINQTAYLANKAGFEYWFTQPNRNIGQLAKHSNGFLSRYEPTRAMHIKLPGLPGRGVLVSEFNYGEESFAIFVVHLALAGRSQKRQFEFLAHLACRYKHFVFMGDFNQEIQHQPMLQLLHDSGLQSCQMNLPTFPSWRPQRRLDHILVSRHLHIQSAAVLDYALSDHLPVQIDITLPDTVRLVA